MICLFVCVFYLFNLNENNIYAATNYESKIEFNYECISYINTSSTVVIKKESVIVQKIVSC